MGPFLKLKMGTLSSKAFNGSFCQVVQLVHTPNPLRESCKIFQSLRNLFVSYVNSFCSENVGCWEFDAIVWLVASSSASEHTSEQCSLNSEHTSEQLNKPNQHHLHWFVWLAASPQLHVRFAKMMLLWEMWETIFYKSNQISINIIFFIFINFKWEIYILQIIPN